jgi:hypothetical protein
VKSHANPSVEIMDRALIDCGAIGEICGADIILVLEGSSEHFVDVRGLLAGHKVNQLHNVTAQALITTYKGITIATFHEMALLGKNRSILSCIQMASHGPNIKEKPHLFPGGKQHILMNSYQLPMDINNGLGYLVCCPNLPLELETLPHIIMTADVDWNPSTFNKYSDNGEALYDGNDD